MNWATRRRFLYAFGVLLLFVALFGASLFSKYYRPPTCSDGIQNQEEVGIDCGGPCIVACRSQVAPPIVLWSRVFPLAEGVSNAVAYVENSNMGMGTAQAQYEFKLYDEDNVLVAQRKGVTFIAPNEKFTVFESRIFTGSRVAKTAFFQFTGFGPWVKTDASKKPLMFVRGESASEIETAPRVNAVLMNGTLSLISNIDVSAIVYDKDENAIAASATKIDALPKDTPVAVSFTWPKPFPSSVARIEIIPRINPFQD